MVPRRADHSSAWRRPSGDKSGSRCPDAIPASLSIEVEWVAKYNRILGCYNPAHDSPVRGLSSPETSRQCWCKRPISIGPGRAERRPDPTPTALTVDRFALVCWLAFGVYWFVSARSAKENADRPRRWNAIGFRVPFAILVLLVVRLQRSAHLFTSAGLASGPLAGAVEVAAIVLGLGFAVWARVHLGRNWGMPMSFRKEHEFVATGPYAFVRHPIYTGILFAMLGSALRGGVAWLVLFLAFGGYLVYSAGMEERDMLRQFPNRYPEYMTRTKMLIPFVF